ncbi:MAG TPA: HIRAN domain-containing protein [Clostridia bacterium]|nr:HIRAN domain-containing protein [Clostridia bacterium]
MSTRTPAERTRDEELVERALLGKLLPPHDLRRHTKVVGVTHNNEDGTSRQDAIWRMTQFDFVDLVRDPHDAYSADAIEVIATIPAPPTRCGQPGPAQRIQIGHLDAELAADMAPRLDAGEKWKAIATRVGGKISRGVSLMLFRLANPVPPPRVDDGPHVGWLHCLKCEKSWLPRSLKRPKVCPRCNNPGWDKGPKRARAKCAPTTVTSPVKAC